MRLHIMLRSLALAAVLAASCLSTRAQACSVPVFRYALERWWPDPYFIEIRHHGPLDAKAQAAADLLVQHAEDETAPANLDVRYTDLSKKTEDAASTATAQVIASGPRMVVRYPFQTRNPEPIWDKLLTTANVEALVDSPARKEMARRIMGGDSSVWYFLESGHAKKDAAARAVLKKELAEAQSVMKVPEEMLAEIEEFGAAPGPPLKIAFSIMDLKRDDPKEAFLVASLLKSEPDLLEFDEPMAFPMYGRGRALFALVGPGINSDTIFESSAFLTGACSCEIKSLNPGTDLLVKASWFEAFEEVAYSEMVLPPLVGMGTLAEAASESTSTVATTSSTQASPVALTTATAVSVVKEEGAEKSNLGRNLAIMLAALALIVLFLAPRMLKQGGGK